MTSSSSAREGADGPDPSWKDFYRVGGICAILYVILGMIVPALLFMTVDYDATMDGETALQFIAENRSWWIAVQHLTLVPSFFAIIAFMALFVVLKHLDKSYIVVGTGVAIVCQILFLVYLPVVQGMLYMSDQYEAATNEAQRAALVSAAEALVAQNSATSYVEIIFGIGVLFVSIAMLKGVFHKWHAYLGIGTFAASIIGMALEPIVGIAYFWWWFVFMIWFIAIGWELYKLGGPSTHQTIPGEPSDTADGGA